MNKLLLHRIASVAVAFAIVAAISIAGFVFAAEKKEARVTEIIREVRLLSPSGGARPAAVNENVREGTAVRTGRNSRAELMFPDQTLARLGENTVFSLGSGPRTVQSGKRRDLDVRAAGNRRSQDFVAGGDRCHHGFYSHVRGT